MAALKGQVLHWAMLLSNAGTNTSQSLISHTADMFLRHLSQAQEGSAVPRVCVRCHHVLTIFLLGSV